MHFKNITPVALRDTALFKPLTLGPGIELQHRVAFAPMTRLRNKNFCPTSLVKEYYDQRSRTPGSLIVTEATAISWEYGSAPPVSPSISTEEQVEAWKPIHRAIHSNGSFSFQQLWATGRQAYPAVVAKTGRKYISASDGVYADEATKKAALDLGIELHGLTKEEIKECIEHFVISAKNSLRAGADGVEIHGAAGYLPQQFLDPITNKRTDEYGGSIENRARFTLEIVDALIDAVGAEKVGIRLSPWETYGSMTGYTDPISIVQHTYLISELERRGREGKRLAYISLFEPRQDMILKEYGQTTSPFSNDFIYSIWNGVVIRCGDYHSHPELAAKHAEMGQTLIAYGRIFISNPDLPERLRNGYKLTQYIRDLFYTSEAKGYTDYPTYEEIEKNGFPEDKSDDGAAGIGYEEALRGEQK